MKRLCLIALALVFAGCDASILPAENIAGNPVPVDPTRPVDPVKPADPYAHCATDLPDVGRPTVRRLNRTEYNNSVRDLLNDTTRPADDFPADDFGRGFDNNGDVLSTAPLLVEKYEGAAGKLAKAALAAGITAGVAVRVEAENATTTTGALFNGNAWNLFSAGNVSSSQAAMAAGQYTFSVRALGQQAGPDPVKMALLVDGAQVATFDVPNTAMATFSKVVTLAQGTHVFAVSFLNDFYEAATGADRNLVVDWLEVTKPGAVATGKVLVCDPTTGAACVKQILSTFGRKAWRRPLLPSEVDKLAAIVTLATTEGEAVQAGLELALQAVLLSPNFLFRVELDADPSSLTTHALSDYELASRLSYFLWSSTPDDALSAEANAGTLKANLEAQTRRMLKDAKASALVSQFAGSWLGGRAVEDATTSATLFPTVTPALKRQMREQMDRFFQSFLDEDRSALELLGSDYGYLNDALATHYGLTKPGTTAMSRVAMADPERATILGHAGVLMLTSHASRTSPVLRGKWVMGRLLCEEPPPPPPGVQGLKPEAVAGQSLRQQMEAHRSNAGCAACHKVMDPIGFGMEAMDPVGRKRATDDTGFAVDSSGLLPDGRKFNGLAELSATIKADPKLPACMTQELFVFGLGRDNMKSDQCMLRDISTEFKAKGYRLPELIVSLVKSPAFTQRRGEKP